MPSAAMRADVVHAHNLHPLFGWRALAAARGRPARGRCCTSTTSGCSARSGSATATVRRAFAAAARTRCPGSRLRCRGSLPEASAYAVGLRRQQPHLFEQADRLRGGQRRDAAQRLIELGLPAQRTAALTNFVPAAALAASSRAGEGEYALVSGRLVEEKGFDTAIAAARAAGVPLVVAGDGPDEERLRALAAGGEVRFAGRIAPQALAELRARAAVVLVAVAVGGAVPVLGARCARRGRPVLASDRGGLPELVGRESVLAPGEASRLGARRSAPCSTTRRRRRRGAPRSHRLAPAVLRGRLLRAADRVYGLIADPRARLGARGRAAAARRRAARRARRAPAPRRRTGRSAAAGSSRPRRPACPRAPRASSA